MNRFSVSQWSRPGRGRRASEDALGGFVPRDARVLAAKGALFVVADGVGGGPAGGFAARFAVQTILRMYYAAQASPPQAITYALDFANAWLHYWGRMPGYRGMGAAVVAAVMCDGELIVAHVGDCRAYLARGGAAWPLTRDHTWGTEAVASGMLSPTEATRHPYANVLTRSLGARPALGAEARRVLIAPGDRVVLCSDGVTRTAGDAGVAWAIGQRNTRAAANTLGALAQRGGLPDDATAVVIEARGVTQAIRSNVPHAQAARQLGAQN